MLFQPFWRGNQQSALSILFIVLACIKTFFFLFAANPQRNDEVDKFEDGIRDYKTVRNSDQHCLYLREEERWVTVHEPVGAASLVNRGRSKHPGQQHPYDPTEAVTGKHIQRIVQNCLSSFEMNGHIGNYRSQYADEDTLRNSNISRSRGDSDQADHRTYAEANHRRFLASQNVEEHPGQTAPRSCRIRIGEGGDGQSIGAKGRSGIEAKPAKP